MTVVERVASGAREKDLALLQAIELYPEADPFWVSRQYRDRCGASMDDFHDAWDWAKANRLISTAPARVAFTKRGRMVLEAARCQRLEGPFEPAPQGSLDGAGK